MFLFGYLCFIMKIFQWGLVGRGPQEIFRLAAGLWYSERRDIMMALYTLLRVIPSLMPFNILHQLVAILFFHFFLFVAVVVRTDNCFFR